MKFPSFSASAIYSSCPVPMKPKAQSFSSRIASRLIRSLAYILARSPDNFFHSDILLCTSNFSLIVLFVFRLSNERNALDLCAQCSFVSWRNQWFSSRFRASARPFGTLHGSQWKSPTQSSSVRRFFFGLFRSRKKRFFATVNFGKASAREREDKKFTSRIKKEKLRKPVKKIPRSRREGTFKWKVLHENVGMC